MKYLSIFTALILSLTLVSALDFTIDMESETIIREFQNPLNLKLIIHNADTGDYNFYTLADILIEPSQTFRISEESFEKDFTLKPTSTLDVEGYYSFTGTLNHREFEKYDKKMKVNLINLKDAITIESNSINVGDEVVKILITNNVDVNIDNISARFSSILFDTKETFDLESNKITEIFLDIDPDKLKKIKAGNYIIHTEIETPKGTKDIDGKLYLGEKKGITTQEDTSGLIIRSKTITKINSGNVPTRVRITVQKGIISRLFTTFSEEPTSVERNGLNIEYSWTKTKLGPSELFAIKTKTNYIFPLLVVILAFVVIFGFKRFIETKVEIKKSVAPLKTKHGEFALKVNISIKAKTDVENISLIDRVPPIVKIYKKFGILKPDKIDPTTRRITWNIGDLKEGEERVFSYVVYSKVGIVGKFSMPAVTAIFEKNQKILEAESNHVFFLTDQVKKD